MGKPPVFENASFSDFIQCSKDKEIVLFGLGRYVSAAKELLAEHKLEIAYAVDNDFWNHGSVINGIKVYYLDKLLSADPEKICVLICADCIYDIAEQLGEMGIEHVFAMLLFAKELYRHGLTEYVHIVNISITGLTPETYRHFQGSYRANSELSFRRKAMYSIAVSPAERICLSATASKPR